MKRRDLSGNFLKRLEALRIASVKAGLGQVSQAEKGRSRGGRSDFLEHRGYVQGDDTRDIDWNLYARTDEIFIKIFATERKKQVRLFLDLSASMSNIDGKELYACRLAAAIGYIALSNGDSLSLTILGRNTANFDSKADSGRFISTLETAPTQEYENFSSAVATNSMKNSASGVDIFISDFWDSGAADALESLAANRREVILLHVLSQQEVEFPYAGNLCIEDSETNEQVSMHVTDSSAYSQAVNEYIETFSKRVTSKGIRYARMATESSFENAILNFLRTGTVAK